MKFNKIAYGRLNYVIIPKLDTCISILNELIDSDCFGPDDLERAIDLKNGICHLKNMANNELRIQRNNIDYSKKAVECDYCD